MDANGVWNEDTQEFKTRPLLLQVSRNLTAFMTFLIELIREILLGGLETIVAFTSWDFIDAYPWLELPGLPWTICLLYTSPSPRDRSLYRMPSSA